MKVNLINKSMGNQSQKLGEFFRYVGEEINGINGGLE